MLNLSFKIKTLLSELVRIYRLKTMMPFTESDLQQMKLIEEKAMEEAKKKINIGLANHDDVIGVMIRKKSVCLVNSTQNKIWKERERITVQFIEEALARYPKSVELEINIGMHDSYFENYGMLVYSLASFSALNILIPDFYAMKKYDGIIRLKDKVAFTHKKRKAIFIGSSTGNGNPHKNERLQLCNHFLNNNRVQCYINNICQIKEDKIAEAFPVYKEFLHATISISSQLQYKFIITVDGNTASWDRLVWILNSNSVCLKKKSDHVCWYYDFLENGKHYIEFDEFDEIEKIMDTISSEKCEEIIKNANAFVQEFLTYDKQLAYMGHLLYYSSIRQTKDIR